MDDVLTKNDYKGGWGGCDEAHLRARLVEEVGEYFALVAVEDGRGAHAKKELVDVANFCLMLWDRAYKGGE